MNRHWIKLVILVVFLSVLSISFSKEATAPSKLAPPEYLQWKDQVEALLQDKPYVLPAYDPNLGPIAFVNNESSPARLSFELYRSDTYSLSKKAPKSRTLHDFYFAFSWDQKGVELSDSELLHRFTGLEAMTQPNRNKVDETTSLIHDSILEYREDHLKIYQSLDGETQEQNKDLQRAILAILKENAIKNAQVEIVNLERKTNLDFHLIIRDQLVKIQFAVDKHASADTTKELQHYLGDLHKLNGSP
ncbi:hypothetical protein [Brevibacillus reuszeri]|uniref:hypothetical protein n=1 Tax=Brevibacillus reuszeri TaxID=54915 RepID=UPI003D1B7EB3